MINKEDEMFYKDLVNISKKKGYENVHVILTRIDVFEKFVSQRNKNLSISDRSSRISTLKIIMMMIIIIIILITIILILKKILLKLIFIY